MPEPENLQKEFATVVVVVDEVVVDEVVVDEVVVDSSALATPAPTLSRASITTKPSRMYFALNATDLRYSCLTHF